MNARALGQHSLIDFHECGAEALQETETLRQQVLRAVREAGGTIVTDTFHTFLPHGVSGVVVIAESHVTIHTWPEHHYAAVDVFSCGASLDHGVIRDRLATALGSKRIVEKSFPRGSEREG